MRFTGRLVSDKARCAASTRRRSTSLAGVSPVAAPATILQRSRSAVAEITARGEATARRIAVDLEIALPAGG